MATYTKVVSTTTVVQSSYLVDETETGDFVPKFDRNTRETKTNFEDVSVAEWEEVAQSVRQVQVTA